MINELIFGLTTTREATEKTDKRQNRLLHLVSVNVNDSIKRLAAKHIFFEPVFFNQMPKEIMLQAMEKKIYKMI